MQSVVVTGVSSGIGWGCAKVLMDKGFHVYGSVRKAEDGARLRTEFGERFEPLLFDVTDEMAVKASAAALRTRLAGEMLAGLVNNAGIAVPGPLLYLPLADFRRQIEVNLTGQLIATQAFAPLLGAEPGAKGKKGRIVNITSVGGRNASPFVGAYNASKFGLEGLSDSLRRELMVFGVDVIVVAPGAVATPIWDKADALDFSPFENTVYGPSLQNVRQVFLEMGRKGLKPEAIGAAVHTALTASRPRVHYTVTPDPLQNWAARNLPARWVDAITARALGLKRQR